MKSVATRLNINDRRVISLLDYQETEAGLKIIGSWIIIIKSETAVRKGIDNTPNLKVISQLKSICRNILDPIRKHYGKPIRVTSGYRCVELNKAIGG